MNATLTVATTESGFTSRFQARKPKLESEASDGHVKKISFIRPTEAYWQTGELGDISAVKHPSLSSFYLSIHSEVLRLRNSRSMSATQSRCPRKVFSSGAASEADSVQQRPDVTFTNITDAHGPGLT